MAAVGRVWLHVVKTPGGRRTRSAAPRLSLPPHAPETRGLAEKASLTLLLQWGGGGPSAGHRGPGRACTPGEPCASGSSEAERQPRPIPGEETTANITVCSRSLPAAETAFSQKRTQTCHTSKGALRALSIPTLPTKI